MNYATIKPCDVANGLGVRVSLFVSGCTHKCKGCFNAEAWDFNYGEPYTDETEQKIIDLLNHDYITGLSLLGGEPFEPQNQPSLLKLLRRVRKTYPDKDVWCYSGYSFEKDILAGKLGDPAITREMISYIDTLVDGEFVEAKKDLHLRFRGSSNQRIIDVKKSLESGETVLWSGKWTI
ncbi:MAG: anaerobic ribonucleoside-triphosphate reductase activating protein [Acutalibacteraceae bacterium]